jgi:hypothetical protein
MVWLNHIWVAPKKIGVNNMSDPTGPFYVWVNNLPENPTKDASVWVTNGVVYSEISYGFFSKKLGQWKPLKDGRFNSLKSGMDKFDDLKAAMKRVEQIRMILKDMVPVHLKTLLRSGVTM